MVFTNCQNPTEVNTEPTEAIFYGDTSIREELFEDPHSFSTEASVVKHLDWDAEVDFQDEVIRATATWTLEESHSDTIIFDTKNLQIVGVTLDGKPAEWSLGQNDELLGTPLIVALPLEAQKVTISNHG